MKRKYTVYGPVSDCSQFGCWWQVLGPRLGVKSEWVTRVAAQREAKRLNKKAGVK